MKGANPTELENKINQHKGSGVGGGAGAFSGVGNKLGGFGEGTAGFGWDGVGSPPTASSTEAKEARLRAVEARNVSTITKDADKDAEEELMLKKAMEMSQGGAGATTTTTPTPTTTTPTTTVPTPIEIKEDQDDEFVPVPVDESLLSELTGMGFHDVRSRKAIIHGKSMEGALEWLGVHQDDPNIDLEPYMVRRADALSQGTSAVPLTEEQKAAKMEELKQRILKRKAERAVEEKQDAIKSEKERRERGQTMNQVQEDRDRAVRRREMEKQKKEKDTAIKERARLKALIAADKEERKRHGGVLPSVLGSEGYNPSAMTEKGVGGVPTVPTGGVAVAVAPPVTPVPVPVPILDTSVPIQYTTTANNTNITAEMLNKVDNLIQTVARYKIGMY